MMKLTGRNKLKLAVSEAVATSRKVMHYAQEVMTTYLMFDSCKRACSSLR